MFRLVLILTLFSLFNFGSLEASEPMVIDIWSEKIPGPESQVNGPEQDFTKPTDRLIAGRKIIKLGNVSKPQIHVYLPTKEHNNGGAIVICPGGGFSILAWDLEGTEVAEWLNELGFAAIVLKYRVPTRQHGSPDKWIGPVMDAQRALSLTRSRASEWKIDPDKIGILGFSAGGETAALTTIKQGERLYEPSDHIDKSSCEVNYTLLIYPGGIIDKDGSLRSDYKVNEKTPPIFFAHAADDRVTCLSSVALFTALKKANVPAELHIFATGGHGYGLRETEQPVTKWTDNAESWLKTLEVLSK